MTAVSDMDEGHVGDMSAKGKNRGGEKRKGRGDTRGGLMRREEAEQRGAKIGGRSTALLVSLLLYFLPLLTWPSSTSATTVVSPMCHQHVDSHNARSVYGLERRNFVKRWARMQKIQILGSNAEKSETFGYIIPFALLKTP